MYIVVLWALVLMWREWENFVPKRYVPVWLTLLKYTVYPERLLILVHNSRSPGYSWILNDVCC